MQKNYEIKARIVNYDLIKWKIFGYINKYSDKQHIIEKQKDIYYKVNKGRLKLRIINNEKGNLIYYYRYEKSFKRTSKYSLVEIFNPDEINLILKKFFSVKATINKNREIFVVKNIRFNLDKVKNLGNFLEIEIGYTNINEAKRKMGTLLRYFNLSNKDLIKNSYLDLIEKKQT